MISQHTNWTWNQYSVFSWCHEQHLVRDCLLNFHHHLVQAWILFENIFSAFFRRTCLLLDTKAFTLWRSPFSKLSFQDETSIQQWWCAQNPSLAAPSCESLLISFWKGFHNVEDSVYQMHPLFCSIPQICAGNLRRMIDKAHEVLINQIKGIRTAELFC